jgi:hypothetical protein
MLDMEFALTYGNDWFIVPLPTDIDTLSTVETLITDTFGLRTLIQSAEQTQVNPGETPWSMFKLSGDAARLAFVFVAPTLGVTDQALVAISQSIRMTEKASVVRRLFSLAASPSIFVIGAIVFTIFRGFDLAVVLFNERRAIRLREPDSTPYIYEVAVERRGYSDFQPQQYRKLMKQYQSENHLGHSAIKAGIDPKTAGK